MGLTGGSWERVLLFGKTLLASAPGLGLSTGFAAKVTKPILLFPSPVLPLPDPSHYLLLFPPALNPGRTYWLLLGLSQVPRGSYFLAV